ncbi:Nitrate/nitrite transporter NarK [Rhizobiales bacterium GAS188]|nr:Nitrate/nitrite transporter NarK [Rhizobiales bacterium GAS188]
MARPWPSIILIWGIGVLAAAQLGKLAALMPLLRRDLDLSLAQAGWLVSLIEASGACLGLVAGLAIGRVGSRTALTAGLSLLASACLAEALATGIAALLAARLVESAGYLLIVIAAPSLITSVAGPADRGRALALWSSFVPAGLAIGTALTGQATSLLSWPDVLLLWAVVAAVVLAASFRLPALGGVRSQSFGLPAGAVWLLAAGFGCYTCVEVGVLALLPAYLAEQWGLAASSAGMVTGAASAATLLGSAAASLALGRAGSRRGRGRALCLIATGLLVPALMLFAAFPQPGMCELIGVGGVCLLAVGLNAASGLVPAVTFARLPDLANLTAGRVSDVATANGLLAQFGAAGSLAGPPLLGFVASRWGWASLAPAASLCSVLSLGFIILAERRA